MALTTALALLAATSLIAGTPETPAASPADASNSAELSVLTYNVHGLPWPLTSGRTKSLREIGQELAKMRLEHRQPDIVLIQEGFTGGVSDLIRLSGYRYWAKGPKRHDRTADVHDQLSARYRQTGEGWGKFTSSGLYVLSDYPVEGAQSQPYGSCAGWDCLANKGVMLVHIAVAGVPGGIDVVNTHMNSRGAARVPRKWSLKAYDRQVSQFNAFLQGRPDPSVSLLVGGDFNIRHAPDRYAQVIASKAFKVVGESCPRNAAECAPVPDAQPRLDSQDLQAFANDGPVVFKPIRAETLFDARETPRLSDHDGYLVRYRLSWPDPTAAAPAVTVRPPVAETTVATAQP